MRLSFSILIGLVTAVVATNLGYNATQWEWWGIFALAEVPYIVGNFFGDLKE